MRDDEVTAQILGAWDDDPEAGEQTAEPVTTTETDEPEVESAAVADEEESGAEEDEADESSEEAADEGEEDDADEADEGGEEGEAEEEDEEQAVAEFDTDDPEVTAFLSKYQGNVERALKGAAQMQRAVSRQGQDKVALQRRVAELEAELQQAQAFSPVGVMLAPEQQQWVQEATESDNPMGYVQAAVQAGEFALARAVCDTWAQESPYDAMRASQAVDTAEYQYAAFQQQQTGAESLDHQQLLQILIDNGYDQLPQYEQQMVQVIETLGDQHPLVLDARSEQPEVVARGIIGLYEIARAQSVTTRSTREKVKSQRRQAARDVREQAVVSSTQQAPTPGESPVARPLMPGLTLEALDAEWDNE